MLGGLKTLRGGVSGVLRWRWLERVLRRRERDGGGILGVKGVFKREEVLKQ